jgi:hypothetical protein
LLRRNNTVADRSEISGRKPPWPKQEENEQASQHDVDGHIRRHGRAGARLHGPKRHQKREQLNNKIACTRGAYAAAIDTARQPIDDD